MKIFSAAQIREWDAYTIENEPIASIELMNRAARIFTDWLLKNYPDSVRPILVLAGTGNNGGDGLAVARMLDQAQFAAKVLVCDFGAKHSVDFEAQLAMISGVSPVKPVFIKSFADFLEMSEALFASDTLVIDALLGSGLSRPLAGEWAQLIGYLNNRNLEIVSIDIPSGLFCDVSSIGNPVLQARKTFSFEVPKLAFFLPENAGFLGEWHYGSIGLHSQYAAQTETPFHYLEMEAAKSLRRVRSKFSHKGSFGHALIIAGSYGKMGAAVLAARACLRSGAGLLTVHAPRCGNIVLQTCVPEAMLRADRRARFWAESPDVSGFSSIGIGPGIGQAAETATALYQLLQQVSVSLVLDADALNILSKNPDWMAFLPENTILTPHPREFERLFGKTAEEFQRLDLLRKSAQNHKVFIVLKGAHTAIAFPDGACWFNATGNPGMATGGSGDVLTGIVTGLLAQGYPAKSACLLGVFLHGLAGDLAAETLGQEALIAGDLVDYLGAAWRQID